MELRNSQGRRVRNWYVPKKLQLEQTAAAMRERNLNHGKGCKTRAKAIAARVTRGVTDCHVECNSHGA